MNQQNGDSLGPNIDTLINFAEVDVSLAVKLETKIKLHVNPFKEDIDEEKETIGGYREKKSGW